MSVQADVNEISQDMPLSANAVVVLKRRYLKKDVRGCGGESRAQYVPP
jgi:hypothetical protein